MDKAEARDKIFRLAVTSRVAVLLIQVYINTFSACKKLSINIHVSSFWQKTCCPITKRRPSPHPQVHPTLLGLWIL